MKKKYCIIAFIYLLAACQKGIEPFDDSGPVQPENNITGTWNFISLKAHTETTLEYIDAGTDYKTISTSDYISTDNTGTITFDSAAFNSAGIGYNVSSIVNSYSYTNNVLVDSSQMPFTITLANSNSTGNYELIGSDSIYFPEGSFVSSSGTTTTEPSGGKINISGNMLTITQMVYKDTALINGGVPYQSIEAVTAITQLQKK